MGLGLLCPGQGSQHTQLFAPLAGDARAGAIIAAVADALGLAPTDIAPTLSPSIAMGANSSAQILVTGCTLAWWEVLRPALPTPAVVLGYSVGELAAHAVAGAMPASDAIRLAGLRARLMDGCVSAPQAMLGVPACPEPLLRHLLSAFAIEIAIRNAPGHVVLGGLATQIEAAAEVLEASHIPHRRIDVRVASHTSLMRDAVGPFRETLLAAGLKRPDLPILSGCLGTLVRTPAEAADTLAMQLGAPLNWQRCLEMARERGATCFLEIGPERGLARMASEIFPDIPARSVEDFRSVEGISAWVFRHADR